MSTLYGAGNDDNTSNFALFTVIYLLIEFMFYGFVRAIPHKKVKRGTAESDIIKTWISK